MTLLGDFLMFFLSFLFKLTVLCFWHNSTLYPIQNAEILHFNGHTIVNSVWNLLEFYNRSTSNPMENKYIQYYPLFVYIFVSKCGKFFSATNNCYNANRMNIKE